MIENYRGIAILSAIPKLFEKLVKSYLDPELKQLISPKQHGFFPGRSTTSNLVLFTSFVSRTLESGGQIDCLYGDFSKAFDKLNHNVLLWKLNFLNTDVLPIAWIKSYPTNRDLYEQIGDFRSTTYVAQSGVLEGSHLGTLLFNLFFY